jgi:iron complex outermembrane receptor protein
MSLIRIGAGCAALLGALLPVGAFAQSTAASSDAAQQTQAPASGGLEEVTVTARRRSENISNVPISITAIDANELASRTIRSETDLQVAVPGLIVRSTAVSTQQNYSIRGQSIDAFTGSSPAVLAYTNEVETNTGGPSSFFDLGSIQVLKGPQGTLFGRNTTGGAVLFTTAEPEKTFGGYGTFRGGNLGLKEGLGALNLPFNDVVQLRLAGDYFSRDGFQHDVSTAQDFGGIIRRVGRATLVLKPVDGLSSKTVVEYGTTKGHPVINTLYSYYACGGNPPDPPPPAQALVRSAGCLFGPALDASINFPGAWNAYLAAHPGANPGGIPAALTRQQQLGIWGVDSPQPNSIRQLNWSATNTTSYEISDAVQFKNIVGVSRSFVDFIADQAGIPYGISIDYNTATGAQGNRTTLNNWSEEAQLLGKAFDAKLDYAMGLYVSSNRHHERDELTYFDLSPIIPGAPTPFDFITTAKSKAAYAQGTYDLSSITAVEGLKATGGLRYTWETDGLQYPDVDGATLGGQPSESKQFSSPSWNVGIDYQMTHGLLLYIAQRGSWRSGGFNGYSVSIPTTAENGGNEFLPEKTHDVELGAKFRGSVLDMPTALNIAVYNQWITNIQRVLYTFNSAGTASALTANIKAGQVRGVDFDGEVSPSPWLTLGVNGAFTDARYTDDRGIGPGGKVVHYGPYGDVSRLSGSVFTQFNLPTPKAWGDMSVRADLYAQSYEYFSNLNNTLTPLTKLPGYGVLNLRYDWHEVLGTGATISGFAKNVLNRGYYTGGEAFGADFGMNNAAPAEPRTYGAEITYKF